MPSILQETLAEKIRQFVRDLFGSRLVATLELRVIEIQQEHERRVADKDDLISSLRSDLAAARAKLELWESVIIPLTSPAANILYPKPKQTFEAITGPEPGSWAWVQQEHYRKEAELAAAEVQSGE
jgi:hypothetical protein